MNRSVFVDTSAWIALANKGDQFHAEAVRCLEELVAMERLLVTSNFVLDESYTRISRKAGGKVAVLFGEAIRTNRKMKVLTIDSKIEKRAWNTFKKYSDHLLSYTDSTSEALMRINHISDVFAFDRDFILLGFHLIPSPR